MARISAASLPSVLRVADRPGAAQLGIGLGIRVTGWFVPGFLFNIRYANGLGAWCSARISGNLPRGCPLNSWITMPNYRGRGHGRPKSRNGIFLFQTRAHRVGSKRSQPSPRRVRGVGGNAERGSWNVVELGGTRRPVAVPAPLCARTDRLAGARRSGMFGCFSRSSCRNRRGFPATAI